MPAYQSYMICTSPRSGSTLLCRLLAAMGVSGDPDSLFHEPSVDNWANRVGVVPTPSQTELEVLEQVFAAAIKEGRGGSDVFGFRQQPDAFPTLCEKLALLYPNTKNSYDAIERAFGRTLIIYLNRSDKVEQAVSWVMAEQTGLWHRAADGSELERIKPHEEPRYDPDRIGAIIRDLIGYDRDWNSWFDQEGINPLRISYDDLSKDPSGSLRTVLTTLGLDQAAADGVVPPVKKLANSLNEEWVARYKAEVGEP